MPFAGVARAFAALCAAVRAAGALRPGGGAAKLGKTELAAVLAELYHLLDGASLRNGLATLEPAGVNVASARAVAQRNAAVARLHVQLGNLLPQLPGQRGACIGLRLHDDGCLSFTTLVVGS